MITRTLRTYLGLLPLAWAWAVGAVAAENDVIPLPAPQTEGGRPFMQVLRDRKTVREFSTNALSLQHLSNLLWAGGGINRPENGHRTAPSAMNSQEIDLYLLTREGAYVYEPKSQQLRLVAAGDLRAKTGGQDFIRQAPCALLFVADLPRLDKAAPSERPRYAWIDTGYMSQNVYLYCASAGLATVVHELDRAQLKDALKLKADQLIVLAQAVGYPAVAPVGAAPAR